MISYDIACQWHPHLFSRLQSLPEHIRIDIPEGELRFVIPKYHFAGHKQKDHNQLSLNLTAGSCRTDGEEIERVWWKNDATAASTREMGPGSRHDTLEDHFGSINWQKGISLGTWLSYAVFFLGLTVCRKIITKATHILSQGSSEVLPDL